VEGEERSMGRESMRGVGNGEYDESVWRGE
jgi:hypothetical protein